MVKIWEQGGYWTKEGQILPAEALEKGDISGRREAAKGTIAYGILERHNTAPDMEKLQIRFDSLASHDITFVGIIQTARASGLERFPMPYVLTNCHNSLCAVGGTINEDDHMFGLSCAKRYGGIYVPPHQAVIHQYEREQMAQAGGMILGSDSHTRYGALGTLAMGEGGPELVKQLLGQTYDIDRPQVAAIYLSGTVVEGVGPQDVALAIIGQVFAKGTVKNRIMEFVGPGVAGLSADFRIGVDVMTTETTCLSSIWQTDGLIEEYYSIHGRPEAYKELRPAEGAYYDIVVEVDLGAIRPMIAMPFHPSNTYTIEELNENLEDLLPICQEKAQEALGEGARLDWASKVKNGRFLVDQGIIAGCSGGCFENICHAADILRGKNIGSDAFTLSVYPSSTPIYMEMVKNGVAADLMASGAVLKTAFCGPCFGAGDTPSNQGFSIRHTTRNFPSRDGSKPGAGQWTSVALMDARSIAATAARGGYLTPATEFTGRLGQYKYFFDQRIYANRIFDSKGVADSGEALVFGPNIKDWPAMPALPENLLLRVVSEIHDTVTTTDELIPSGETSSYRSNPLGLAEFTLSRRDPAYVGRAKEMRALQQAHMEGLDPWAVGEGLGLEQVREALEERGAGLEDLGFGSLIFANKPGDGSAREQAASCQRVLGGWANIAREYATKRYRSNLINWGMLPLLWEGGDLPFANLDYIYLPDIRAAVERGEQGIKALAIGSGGCREFALALGEMTAQERQIILKGCLINYNRVES